MHKHISSCRPVVALVAALVLSACSKQGEETPTPSESMTIAEMLAQQQDSLVSVPGEGQGQFEQFETYMATIHSYTAPEDSHLVTSHIIETDNALVLIDAQYLRPYAEQLKNYVDDLGKPLNRIYLSHERPTQWFGVEFFPGVPVYAQQPVAEGVAQLGETYVRDARNEFGELVTDIPITIDKVLQVHSDIVDGLTYEFELIKHSESEAQTLIRLPEVDVAFVQNLMSHNAHSFFSTLNVQEWIRNLAVFSVDAKDSQIFVGYGFPARVDATQINRQISYLQTAKQILIDYEDAGASEMAEAMKAAYPDLGASSLADTAAWHYKNVLKAPAN